MTFEEYKLKEFKGDALAKFIAVELVSKYYPNCDRKFYIDKVCYWVSNNKFAQTALRLGLCFHGEDNFMNPSKPYKNFANAFEVKLYQVYEIGGLSAAIDFFENNIVSSKVTTHEVNDTTQAK